MVVVVMELWLLPTPNVLVATARSPLWFDTVIATAARTAAAPAAISSVPLPISCAVFTPAGLPGANVPSAAKAEEPTIVTTVIAATTLLKPNIGFPRLFDARILVRSCNPSQRPFPDSFLTVAKRLYRAATRDFAQHFTVARRCYGIVLLHGETGKFPRENGAFLGRGPYCNCEIMGGPAAKSLAQTITRLRPATYLLKACR
jgi:hypothetical protein